MTPHCERTCLAIYLAVHRFIRDNGYAPSHHEIAALVQMPVKRIFYYVRQMEREGLIAKPRRYKTRGIRLVGVAMNGSVR